MTYKTHPGIFAAVTGMLIAACGGQTSSENPPAAAPAGPPPVPQPSASINHGYHDGVATIGGVDHYANALITADGMVRIYVGGPLGIYSQLPLDRPTDAAQFIGNVQLQDMLTRATATGSGVVVGESCTPPLAGRFCAESGTGQLSLSLENGALVGELQVSTSQATEVWTLQMAAWSIYYDLRAAVGDGHGQYKEFGADFAIGSRTIINLDSAGRMFFQSPGSQCVGNGSVTPHADGRFGVYDVVLRLENCVAERQYLNGEYSGLMTFSASNPWNYDSLMHLWMSKPGPPGAAITSTSYFVY
jgi:hypothetical protein